MGRDILWIPTKYQMIKRPLWCVKRVNRESQTCAKNDGHKKRAHRLQKWAQTHNGTKNSKTDRKSCLISIEVVPNMFQNVVPNAVPIPAAGHKRPAGLERRELCTCSWKESYFQSCSFDLKPVSFDPSSTTKKPAAAMDCRKKTLQGLLKELTTEGGIKSLRPEPLELQIVIPDQL